MKSKILKRYLKRIRDIFVFYTKDRKKFTVQKYGVIFSFGYACSTAMFLDNQFLRKFSCPFDWIAGTSFKERCNIFLNKFSNFIRKEDLTPTGEIKGGFEHRKLYRNISNGILHVHDFNVDKNFDDEYPLVEEKYNRRIKRLLDKIEKSEKTLLVYMEYQENDNALASDEEIINFINQANEKYSPSKIDMLYIRHNENMSDGEFTIEKLNDNVFIAQCYNKIRGAEGITTGKEKNVRRILQFFRLK